MAILQISDEIELISRALTRSATHLCHPPWKNSSRKKLEGARTKLRLDITPNTPKANLVLALHLDLNLRTGTWLPFPYSLTAAAAAEDEGASQQGRCICGRCISYIIERLSS